MIWPTTAGALVLTNDTTGARWVAGLLRRPTDGALVGTTAPGAPRWWAGFVRDTNGALVYNVGGAAAQVRGVASVAADGSLCTAAADPGLPAHHGLRHDSAGRVYATVVA